METPITVRTVREVRSYYQESHGIFLDDLLLRVKGYKWWKAGTFFAQMGL